MSLCILRKVEGIKEWNVRGDHDIHCANKIITLEIIKTLFPFWGGVNYLQNLAFCEWEGAFWNLYQPLPQNLGTSVSCGDCYNTSDNKN